MKEWLDRDRPFVRSVKASNPDKRATVWFQDEMRAGPQGTLSTVWAPAGNRPTRVRRAEYAWVYLFAAVDPATGRSPAVLAPHADTH